MAERHIAGDLLERFLRLEAPREESRRVVRHLLRGCPRCTRRVSESCAFGAPGKKGAEGQGRSYDDVFARSLASAKQEERRVALEKLCGWSQWAYLEPLSPQVRLKLVESDPACHTFGFFERLLEAARWYSRREPAEGVDIVRLAIVVVERLDPDVLGEELLADLTASAWGALGNAQRIASDFEGARQAFAKGWRILDSGTGDPAERARLVSLEASYLKDVGEFEAAESRLEEALEIYRKLRDAHGQGRTLFQMGDASGYADPRRGLAYLQQAESLLDPTREPWLEMYLHHDRALFLAESGQPEEALAVLERSRPLIQEHWDDLTQLRRHWVEAKIAFRLGELAQAEAIFGQLWEEFRVRDMDQEVVLVTIELAQVLTLKGELPLAARLAAESYGILEKIGLHGDALTAWRTFRDALSRGALANDLFGRLQDYYRRWWVRPGRFEL